MNKSLWVMIGVMMLLTTIISRLQRPASGAKPSAFPYRRKDYLLTRAERCFFDSLQTAVRNSWHVSAKVRLADLFFIVKGTGAWQSHFNRINAKHVDFVLCRPSDMRPMAAIELDDRSHERKDRIARDEFVNDLFKQTGFPLIRIPASNRYDARALRQQIEAQIGYQSES